MKEVRLTSTTLVALVDDEDYERVIKYNWSLSNKTGKNLRIRSKIKQKEITLANFVSNYTGYLDHKDRNPLNNQKENLRPCTYSQNAANKTKYGGRSSQYKGVTWNKRLGKWIAQININGGKNHLGTFLVEQAAAQSYDKAALKAFREFAVINFPERLKT